ncbi:Putative peptidoglycan-binding domain-containing protein [Crocosphaera watsonii WH 0005]|uniref:Putative peptidoglycan-binding domain-containing protein n=1 Tax=Crocosphaera watsonii WH 0005 TaxID=423472 RepID=T2J1H9_CROWT|nr:Putative peptidoglycan-binding domain-containing protein [Crocosphaera watsonii WH 0005]
MIYYRLSLLILICLSYLTCPSLSLANSNLFSFDEISKKEKKIAQGNTNNSPTIPSTPSRDIDTDSQERSLILEALSQISTRTLKPMNHALTLSLQDKNPQVRKNAIRDLTRIHDLMSQIYQLLCHSIEDSDREVQETAKWAINQLNTQIPPRLDMVTGENPPEVTVEEPYSDFME